MQSRTAGAYTQIVEAGITPRRPGGPFAMLTVAGIALVAMLTAAVAATVLIVAGSLRRRYHSYVPSCPGRGGIARSPWRDLADKEQVWETRAARKTRPRTSNSR